METATVYQNVFWLKAVYTKKDNGSLTLKTLAKLVNIAWQTLMFVSESLAVDKKVTLDLRWKQQCLASNVGQFRKALMSLTSSCGTRPIRIAEISKSSNFNEIWHKPYFRHGESESEFLQISLFRGLNSSKKA